jgi:hypothetical protein
VVYNRYVGTAAGTGVYKFGWRSNSKTVSEGAGSATEDLTLRRGRYTPLLKD